MATNFLYSNQRNTIRRVNSLNGRKARPNYQRIIEFRDGTMKTIDINGFQRHNDFYLFPGNINNYPVVEYVEKVLNVNYSEIEITEFFPFEFSDIPIVTIEIIQDPSNPTTNVNPYVTDVFINFFLFGFSAEFSGQVVYRAIYIPPFFDFPVRVFRGPRYPTTQALAAAGIVDVAGNTYVTMSFSPFDNNTNYEFYATTRDYVVNPLFQEDTYIFLSGATYNSSSVQAELSAEYSGLINYIALRNL